MPSLFGQAARPCPPGRTLKPMTIAFDATARLMSPSVMAPTPAWMMATRTFSVDSLASASATASTEPCTSALMMSSQLELIGLGHALGEIFERDLGARRAPGSCTLVLRRLGDLLRLLGVLDDVQRIAGVRAPRRGRGARPASPGPLRRRCWPCSSVIARTLPHAGPAIMMSPTRSVPSVHEHARDRAACRDRAGPRSRCRWRGCFGFALSSRTSAWRRDHLEQLVDAFARLGARRSQKMVSPPHSSGWSPSSTSSRFTRSGSAPGLSILLTATMIGTFAALAWRDGFLGLRHDAVVGGDDQDDDVGHARRRARASA